jgi:hypothetical protein
MNMPIVRISSSAVFLAALAAGCAMDVPTSPDTFPVEPVNAAHLRAPQSVGLKNAYNAGAQRTIDAGKGQTWTVDQKQMTDTAITMLGRAVEKHGFNTKGPGDKSITLQVRAEHGFIHQRTMSFVAQANVTVSLHAAFGDGSSTTVGADNNSPLGPQRAFEGALMFALNKLLNDQRFVAYVNNAGPDALKPAALVPAVVVAPSAAVAAAPAAAPASTSRFPQVGDTWTYELTQRGRNVPAGPRAYAVKVVYSTEAKISDQVTLGGGKPEEWDHARGRYLVTQVVSILSPYLGVFQDPVAGPMGEITTKADRSCGGREQCEVTGRVVGREMVRVPAGEFESMKVSVTQVWRNPSGFQAGFDGRRELTGWYAPKAKRFVKFTSRTKMGSAPDFDLELVRYELK